MQCGVPMLTPPLRQISIRGKRDAGIAQAAVGAEPAGDGPIHCWAPGSQCDRLEDPMEGLRFVSLGLRQERKLSVAHGVLPRVDPTRGCLHFWRSPCAIEGETPWPPYKSGPSRPQRLFFAARSLGTAPAALTLRVGTLSLFSP